MGAIAITTVLSLVVSPAAAGSGEPADGLISAADLPGEWQEVPADGVADFAATVEPTTGICEAVTDLTADIGSVTPVDGPTFTLDGQEFSSYALDPGAKLAKRVNKTYKRCGSKSPLGKNSVSWSAPVFEEGSDGELTVVSDFWLVLARVGPTLVVYVATGDGTEVDQKAVNKAIKAALKRL
ncbi:MAG TPA: hypothetical protein VMQ81_02155 [Acidimicrobiia bacterium]|nr:hypothetical protein [Acidimicrobiia bacterium]